MLLSLPGALSVVRASYSHIHTNSRAHTHTQTLQHNKQTYTLLSLCTQNSLCSVDVNVKHANTLQHCANTHTHAHTAVPLHIGLPLQCGHECNVRQHAAALCKHTHTLTHAHTHVHTAVPLHIGLPLQCGRECDVCQCAAAQHRPCTLARAHETYRHCLE